MDASDRGADRLEQRTTGPGDGARLHERGRRGVRRERPVPVRQSGGAGVRAPVRGADGRGVVPAVRGPRSRRADALGPRTGPAFPGDPRRSDGPERLRGARPGDRLLPLRNRHRPAAGGPKRRAARRRHRVRGRHRGQTDPGRTPAERRTPRRAGPAPGDRAERDLRRGHGRRPGREAPVHQRGGGPHFRQRPPGRPGRRPGGALRPLPARRQDALPRGRAAARARGAGRSLGQRGDVRQERARAGRGIRPRQRPPAPGRVGRS